MSVVRSFEMSFKFLLKSFDEKIGFKNEINWSTSIILVGFHIFGVYWCWHFAFPVKILTVLFAVIMHFVSGTGITCGVHRLFTHKSYKVNTPLKIFLILCYCSAGQNSIYNWVRDHRLHHKFSDTEADPHNANRGFFFSHIGWLMMKKNEEVKKQGSKIDMSDIESDKIIMFQEKYFIYLKLLCAYILPVLINMYLWNESWKCAIAWQCVIKNLAVLHAEMTVNSLAHMYGYKPYNKNIKPKENKFVSTITFGEGWHNYHHMFPYDFKAAEYFDTLNFSTAAIRWWAKKGWAYDLKEPSPDVIKAVMKRVGEGNHMENDGN